MAFKGGDPVRTKIVIDNKIMEKVHSFNYLRNTISYEKELDIDNKLHTRVGTLSPCDFDLIPEIPVPEILQAVDRSIRTINTTGAAKGILRLPHRWQRVAHNAGDYSEGQ